MSEEKDDSLKVLPIRYCLRCGAPLKDYEKHICTDCEEDLNK